jgi:hypothetical protein
MRPVRAWRVAVALAALALAAAGAVVGAARAAEPTVQEVQAAFLARFPRFVVWPDTLPPGAAFRIGLMGGDPFGPAGHDVMAARPLQNRRVEVRRLASPGEAESCRVVFFAGAGRASGPVPRVRGVLTVGEGPDFLAAGGIIAFRVADQRVRFDIDLDAAHAAGLRLNSQLIGVADVVRGRRRQEP